AGAAGGILRGHGSRRSDGVVRNAWTLLRRMKPQWCGANRGEEPVRTYVKEQSFGAFHEFLQRTHDRSLPDEDAAEEVGVEREGASQGRNVGAAERLQVRPAVWPGAGENVGPAVAVDVAGGHVHAAGEARRVREERLQH